MVAEVEYQCWCRQQKNAAVAATEMNHENTMASVVTAAVDRENATVVTAAMDRESVTGVVAAVNRGRFNY